MKDLLTGNEAIAQAVLGCSPDLIAAYPITPQTEIIEKISEYVDNGILNSDLILSESEYSAFCSCMGGVAAGARVFTATSSHGLLYGYEAISWAGMSRLGGGYVLALVNRTLSPWNIWAEDSDFYSIRDCGWIQIMVKSSQEAYDTIIQAYKISENPKVMLPVVVSLAGFIVSHTSEVITIENKKSIEKYLGRKLNMSFINFNKPISHGAVSYPEDTVKLRNCIVTDMEASKDVIKAADDEFHRLFNRSWGGLVEYIGKFNVKKVIIAMGAIAQEVEEVILNVKKNIALLRVRVFRPWPCKEIVKYLKNKDEVYIIDRGISFGNEGPLAIEIKSTLYKYNIQCKVKGIVLGIGGSSATYKEILKII